MYVVCLDCGKHFHYDWELMRMGQPMESPAGAYVQDEKPAAHRPILRYLLAAITLPVLWLIGKAARRRKRLNSEKEQKT